MMRDSLSLGPTPPEEECIQVGDELYYPLARAQCNKYIEAIKAYHGELPYGVTFKIKSCPHDGLHLGDVIEYLDVEVYYTVDESRRYQDLEDSDNFEEDMDMVEDESEEISPEDYAFRCESHPNTWKEAGMKDWDRDALIKMYIDQIATKLHPSRFPNMSPRMAALVGYFLDKKWMDPQIVDLCLTTDKIVLAGTTDDWLFNNIIGPLDDFNSNFEDLISLTDLTEAELAIWNYVYYKKHPDKYFKNP